MRDYRGVVFTTITLDLQLPEPIDCGCQVVFAVGVVDVSLKSFHVMNDPASLHGHFTGIMSEQVVHSSSPLSS